MSGDTIADIFITAITMISHFGICLIIFFIGLILFSKKSKTVEGYFSAVASNSIFDLLYATLTTIVKMNCFYKNGYVIFVIHRFDYELDLHLIRIIVTAYQFMAHICLYVVAIPFYIRYSLICKGQNVPYTIRILLYLFVITYDIGIVSLLYMAFEPSPRELVDLQMKPYLKGNEDGRYWNFAGAIVVSSKITLIET